MKLEKGDIYRKGYVMRSAFTEIYGIAEKISRSEDENEKDKLLEKIKQCVNEVAELDDEMWETSSMADVNNFRMRDTRALVVDDNEISNYVVVNALDSYGVEIDVALSGKEALKLFEKNKYDIVFMDYIMPDMDGIETVKRIRKMDGGGNQLIIGITASTVPEFKEGLNSLGVELIITKPIKYEQIGFILMNEINNKVVFDFTREI